MKSKHKKHKFHIIHTTVAFDYLYLTRQCKCGKTDKKMYVHYSPGKNTKAAKWITGL